MDKKTKAVLWIAVLAIVSIRWSFCRNFPAFQGYDGYSHIDYLILCFQGRLPSPAEIWQGYQAPGYYLLSAGLARLLGTHPILTAQAVSSISSVLLAFPVFWLARRYTPGFEPVAVLVVLLFPCAILTSGMVYSISLATLMIALYCVPFVLLWEREKDSLGYHLALGILWGLAILVRFDGLMLGLPTLVLYARRAYQNRGESGRCFLLFLMASMVAVSLPSHVFFRNLADFNLLLFTNRASFLYPYSVEETGTLPGFLPMLSLLNPGWEVWFRPESPKFTSIPALIYVSFWGGTELTAFPAFSYAFLGLPATFAFILGVRRKPTIMPIALVALSNLILTFLFWSRQPDFTNYKACYFHGTYPFLALGVAAGVARLQGSRRTGLCLLLILSAVGVGLAFFLQF